MRQNERGNNFQRISNHMIQNCVFLMSIQQLNVRSNSNIPIQTTDDDDDDCPQFFCPLEEGGGRGGRANKGRHDTNSRRQARTPSHIQLGQGCRIRETGENMDGGVWVHSTTGAEGVGGLVVFSHDRNGGSYRSMNEVVKG